MGRDGFEVIEAMMLPPWIVEVMEGWEGEGEGEWEWVGEGEEEPRGVLGISSDEYDRMEPNVKTQKSP